MYTYDDKYAGMYTASYIPCLKGKKVRQCVFGVDIKERGQTQKKMSISVITLDQRVITVDTDGKMTLKEIVDKITEKV